VWKSVLQFLRRIRREKLQKELKPAPLCGIRTPELKEIEGKLQYSFQDRELVEQALTHKSFTHESGNDGRLHYESLEFLGDSILGFVISEYLYLTYPNLSEGDLSKIKSQLVSARQLHLLSQNLELGQHLRISRGEERTGGRRKQALLADLFESLTAAIYLDGGLEPARRFILSQFRERFEDIVKDEMSFKDHKSTLQEKLHELGSPSPSYEIIEESGPDHRKEFLVSVSSEGQILARGTGGSKKKAEQQAAKRALESLEETASR